MRNSKKKKEKNKKIRQQKMSTQTGKHRHVSKNTLTPIRRKDGMIRQ